MQTLTSIRDKIIGELGQKKLKDDCYVEMLDYTIDLFESQGLGADYYGYHNINHELEVTYVSLLAASQDAYSIHKRGYQTSVRCSTVSRL